MRIVPVEAWKTDRRNTVIAFGISLILGVIMGLRLGAARGIAFGTTVALFLGLRFGKRETDIPIHVRPNQAIEFSMREAARHTIAITSAAVAIFGLAYGLLTPAADGSRLNIEEGGNNAIMALTFSIAFFFFGGIPVIKHWALRWTLAKARLLPLHAIPFLTNAARAGLIRQIGGGFQFSHITIRDYFASKAPEETWGKPTSE